MRRTILTAAIAIGLSFTPSVFAQVQDVAFRSDLTQYIINGEDRRPVPVTVTLTTNALILRQSTGATTVPYSAISSMTYDRRSGVRPVAPAYGKRQKHFLTVQYKSGGIGTFVEIEMGKHVAPNLIATLEARSGQKIDKIVGS